MPPIRGSRHPRARIDSAIRRLWPWMHDQADAWTARTARQACRIDSSRLGRFLRALEAAGLIERVSERTGGQHGATWQLSLAGRRISAEEPPIMITDAASGSIAGLRPAETTAATIRDHVGS